MLGRLLPRARSERSGIDNQFIYSLPGAIGITASAYQAAGGVEAALKNAATLACIRVMTDALSRTPIDVVREVRGQSTPVDPMPKVIGNPSALVAPDVWRAQLGFSIMTDGNVFGSIADTDLHGRPTQIELLDPGTVGDRRVEKGRGVVRIGAEKRELYPFGDIWHMPGDLVPPGSPFGLSPVNYASKVIGTSLSAEDFSYRFFSDGGHPSYLLKSTASELKQEAADAAKASWRRATIGSREPAVMGSAWSVEQFGIDPNETQFIDLMRFCTEQACRVFGVPPVMIFAAVSGQALTYANVTQNDLQWLKNSLEGKFTRIESALTAILPGDSYTAPSSPNTRAVMCRSAILKADIKARYDTYQQGLAARILTINEVRAAEDAEPFAGPEYDLPIVPPFAPTKDVAAVDAVPGDIGPAPVPAPVTAQPTTTP